MSSIKTIKLDMYSAMKNGEKNKANTLRTLLAKLKDRQIQKGEAITEQEGLSVIKTLVKQIKESIELYQQAGRTDLADMENSELQVLETYLPKMMSADEIQHLIETIIAETGAITIGDIGIVMPLVMQRGRGMVDGKIANNILRELLA